MRRYFEMVRAGAEPEAIAALFSETVDRDIPGAVDLVPWIGRRQGRAGVAAFFRELHGRIEPVRFEVRSIVVEDDKAVTMGELQSRVTSTGKTIESEFAIEFIIEDGLIARYRLLEDSFAVALAAKEN